jgi:cellobiose phosphorylase
MAAGMRGDHELAWELLSLINPIRHGSTREQIAKYRVEPYVMPADVYGVAPHTGRGGWTWYTGSAGWMYRLIVDSLIGLRLEGETLRFAPCLPQDWQTFKVHYRHRETFYHITFVQQGAGASVAQLKLDGVVLSDRSLRLVDDRRPHEVEVVLRPEAGSSG